MTRLVRGACASVLVLGVTTAVAMSPASAGVVGGYNIYYRAGVGYQTGKTNILSTTGVTDDRVVNMSTISTGARRLPFALSFYGATYSSINVSSNGNIQFGGTTGSTAYSPTCFPTTTFSTPTLAVIWQDLVFDPSIGEGIFVKTSGATGHKRFVISWRGRHLSDSTFVRAEVVFTQGQTGFVTNYASTESGEATIGVQGTTSDYSQWQCANAGHWEYAGDQLAFAHY